MRFVFGMYSGDCSWHNADSIRIRFTDDNIFVYGNDHYDRQHMLRT